MKLNRRSRYLCSLLGALFLCVGIARADQTGCCFPEGSAVNTTCSFFTWNLRGSGENMRLSVTGLRNGADISRDKYEVDGNGSLVRVAGLDEDGNRVVFFNNNHQYNVNRGDFSGKADKWTLYKQETGTSTVMEGFTTGAHPPTRTAISSTSGSSGGSTDSKAG